MDLFNPIETTNSAPLFSNSSKLNNMIWRSVSDKITWLSGILGYDVTVMSAVTKDNNTCSESFKEYLSQLQYKVHYELHIQCQSHIKPALAFLLVWCWFTSWQHLRSYQDRHRFVRVYTHGDFKVLTYCETRQPASWLISHSVTLSWHWASQS